MTPVLLCHRARLHPWPAIGNLADGHLLNFDVVYSVLRPLASARFLMLLIAFHGRKVKVCGNALKKTVF
jgi:hypothetical protein